MPLLSDLRTASGGHYLYDLLDAPGAGSASAAGATATATAADGSAAPGPTGAGVTATATAAQGHGYRFVQFVAPLRTGPESIFYPSRFDGTPNAGEVCRFPAVDGFNILSDGTIVSDAYGTFVCYYNDGTGEVEFTVELNENADVYAAGATAAASASNASLYGGVNIAGDAPDVTATPSTGTGTAGNIATGAGATATATPSGASLQAGAAAAGAGTTATAAASTGVGETTVAAEGEGVEVTTDAADATASGDVYGSGAGVTAVATPAAGVAVGDRLPGSIPYLAMTTVYPRNVLIARAAA